MNTRRCLEHALSWAVAALFLAAAVPKIIDPASFAKVIHAYKLTPDAWVNLLAVFLPWLELIAAVALFLPGVNRRAGLWLCTLMLVLFTGAQVINILRGVQGTCGCFGSNSKPIGWPGVALNTAFLVAGGAALVLQARQNREAVGA